MARVTLLIALLAAFPPLSTDMYLPAIPLLQSEWNQPLMMVNLTLICFFFTYCLFMLIYGPLSDRYGPAASAAGGDRYLYRWELDCARWREMFTR